METMGGDNIIMDREKARDISISRIYAIRTHVAIQAQPITWIPRRPISEIPTYRVTILENLENTELRRWGNQIPLFDIAKISRLSYFPEKEGRNMSYTITARELKDRLDNGDKVFLLDVREPHENSMAKIEGSVLIPLGTLPGSLDQLNRDAEIVAYCHRGMRSADAVGFLLQQGFPNVKNLVGGIDIWSVEIDPSVPRYR